MAAFSCAEGEPGRRVHRQVHCGGVRLQCIFLTGRERPWLPAPERIYPDGKAPRNLSKRPTATGQPPEQRSTWPQAVSSGGHTTCSDQRLGRRRRPPPSPRRAISGRQAREPTPRMSHDWVVALGHRSGIEAAVVDTARTSNYPEKATQHQGRPAIGRRNGADRGAGLFARAVLPYRNWKCADTGSTDTSTPLI